MLRTPRRLTAPALIVIGLVAADHASIAQGPDDSRARSLEELAPGHPSAALPGADRLRDLILSRSHEHWDRFLINSAPTPPALAQPVRTIPEWEVAGHAILAFDANDLSSVRLNLLCRTADRADDVLSASENLLRDLEQDRPARKFAPDDPRELVEHLAVAHSLIRSVNALRKHVRVLIVVPGERDDSEQVQLYPALLSEFPEAAELVGSRAVEFLVLPLKTKWLRDYGPVFTQGKDGRFICVDSRYNTDRESQEVLLQQRHFRLAIEHLIKTQTQAGGPAGPHATGAGGADDDEEKEDQWSRRNDDIFNTYLAAHLRQKSGGRPLAAPVTVIRPPIELDGGDFLTDGRGTAFTSTQTLRKNGGNIELFELALKAYYGIERTVYMQPLPGRAIKHIDLFLKVVSPDVLLLGHFETLPDDGDVAPLQNDAAQAMEYNLGVLSEFYRSQGREVVVHSDQADQLVKGKVNIIRVPMLTVQTPFKERIDQLRKKLDGAIKSTKQVGQRIAQIDQSARDLEGTRQVWMANRKRLLMIRDRVVGDVAEDNIEIAQVVRILTPMLAFSDNLQQVNGLTDDARKGIAQLKVWVSSEADSVPDCDATVAKTALLSALDDALMAGSILIGSLQSQQAELAKNRAELARQQETLKANAQHTQQRLDSLVQKEALIGDTFRTYLNAIHARTDQGGIVLVPVYHDTYWLNLLVLQTVRKVYSQVYGETEVVPVAYDSLIRAQGAAHCLIRTIPSPIDVLVDHAGQSPSRLDSTRASIRSYYKGLRKQLESQSESRGVKP